MAFTLTSPAFLNNGMIPAKYTCDGNRELSPPLIISDVPEMAKSLVLIMDDPDIPEIVKEKIGLSAYDHWTLYNIPPETREIPEGGTIGTPGATTDGELRYTGPCPPRFSRSATTMKIQVGSCTHEPPPRFSRSATTMKIQVGSCTHEPPPPEHEPSEHRYIFKLYALIAPLELPAGAKKEQVLDALAPLLLAETELIGRYSRK